MEHLDFPRFSIAGHDRGGRVAYRLALDHPHRVERIAVLDILPTATVWKHADARLALAYWPWTLLAQSEPLLGDDVQGQAFDAGHFFPEEMPAETAAALGHFFHST